jgi:hypothetical protein
LAVALSTSLASFWAFWGIVENFHEGWFHESLLLNVGLMFVQYLSPVIIFMLLTLLAIAFPRVGSVAHVLGGLLLWLLLFDLNDRVAMLFVIGPMLILGTLYWYGRPQPRRAAYLLAVGLPILTLVVCGVKALPGTRLSDTASTYRKMEGRWLKTHRMYGACRQWKKLYARCRVTVSTAGACGTGRPKRRLIKFALTKNRRSGMSTRR